MYRYRNLLLTATAAAALMGATATGASAFEVVDWSWTKTVTEAVDIDIDITTDIDPTGLVELEKAQIFFGNVTATATMSDINNNAAGLDGTSGTVLIDETVRIETSYDDDPDPGGIDPAGPVTSGPIDVSVTGGFVDEGSDGMGIDIRVQGEIPFDLLDLVLDAADLPKVENIATAVGNNQAIESDVPLYLHDLQIAAGAINDQGDPDPLGFLVGAGLIAQVDNQYDGLNEFTDAALLTILGAATGYVEPAAITASASVSNILNAYVENAATAVGNNASYKVESNVGANHVVIADLTQLAIANVSASATATAIDLNGYTGFNDACFGGGCGDVTPIVSNVATAVGNNLNIKVGSPQI